MLATSENLALARDGAILEITLNRPDRRNALSRQLMLDLIAALRAASGDREIRVVILRGAGVAFSAGHDLKEMLDRDINAYREIFDICTDVMTTIQGIPQPVIAEVAGIATAAGCQLVATCDLAIAAEEAKFATPGVRIGLFCSTPMVALTRAIGRKRAMEMLLTGEMIPAETAADWGLVNRVVPASRLHDETRALASKIIEASGFVVGLGKAAFYTQIDLDQPKAYAYAKEIMSMNASAADAQEGMGAFVEKRKPTWCGR
ncbi:MAG TPA: enoyl-CoA hydratase [Candidatus Dormibacteraeota bacterium]|nr:enoyl-CoA hydratase [Candidatus Dormibacteraeota bacterium]